MLGSAAVFGVLAAPLAIGVAGAAATTDTTPPVMKFTPSQDPNGPDSWYTGDGPTVTTTANDAESGVIDMRCVLNPIDTPESFDDLAGGCEPMHPVDDGYHRIYAAARNGEGTTSAVAVYVVKIDTIRPTSDVIFAAEYDVDTYVPAPDVVMHTGFEWFTIRPYVLMTADDLGVESSGVYGVGIAPDNSALGSFSVRRYSTSGTNPAPFAALADGVHTLRWYAVELRGQ